MQIGILTFHRACNYGAFLQTYAFQKTLNKYDGVTAYVVDYVSKAIEKNYSIKSIFNLDNGMKSVLLRCARINSIIKRNKIFGNCVDTQLPLISMDSLKQDVKLDKYVVGSDQVWNSNLTEGDTTFYLDFVTEGDKYSYAASFGQVQEGLIQPELIASLNEFKGISVRESDAFTALKNMNSQLPLTVSVDPVFLLKPEEWREYAGEQKITTPYVCVFLMGVSKQNDYVVNAAKAYAEKNKVDLILFGDQERWYKYRDVRHYGVATPKEFISLIDNAECVFTNSFHATSFSIILNTKFYTECNIENPSRVKALLSSVGLEEREMFNGKCNDSDDISWSLVNEKNKVNLGKSFDYIEHDILTVD